MFSKIGYFHFGLNHDNPLQELRRAFADAKDRAEVRGALIVLPEGFNISKLYSNKARTCNYSPAIKKALGHISAEHHVRFVAGLIIDEEAHVRPPYSSAYLIDAANSTLICHKKSDDHSGNYTTRTEGHNINNPTQYEEACVAAVICKDAEYCTELIEDVASSTDACRIICIPAHMSDDSFQWAKAGRTCPTPKWRGNRGSYVVLANSRSNGCDSFIMTPDGSIVCSSTGPVNEIQLVLLARDTRRAVS